jgi:cell division protein FtsB
MAKNKKNDYPVYVSDSDSLSLMRDPEELVESVQGEKRIVMKAPPPIKFVNGQYKPKNDNEAMFMESHRHNGVLFKKLPDVVAEVASGKGDTTTQESKMAKEIAKLKAENAKLKKSQSKLNESIDAAQEESEEPVEDAGDNDVKVVEEVSSYNDAQDYLRENYDLEYKDVNSKEKVIAKMEEYSLEFPNYDTE